MAPENAVATAKRREAASQSQEPEAGRPNHFSFAGYQNDGFYDEMFDDAGQPRPDCQPLYNRIRSISRPTT